MDIQYIPRLGRIVASHRGIELSTLSTEVAKAGHVFQRIEAGNRTVTIKKYQEFLAWFDVNWPEGAAWPEDIPRPGRKDAA